MKKFPTLSAALVIALGMSALGCAPEPIRIALMTKLAAGSLVGSSEVNAARMAVEDHGMAKRVTIAPYDDGWTPEKTRTAWERLRADGIDLVVTSHVSTCAIVVAELAAGQDALVLVTGATTDALTAKDDWMLRTIPDVRVEQAAIAAWVKSRGPRAILVVKDADNWAYTVPALETFAAGVIGSERAGTRLRTVSVSMKEPNLTVLRAAMESEPFDFLYLLIGGSQTAAGTLAQLGRLVQPGCTVLFTPWMKNPNIVETAGPALEGAWMPSFYPKRGTDPGVDSFIDRFAERFGYAPSFISLNVYAAVELLLNRIAGGMRNPGKIRDSLVSSATATAFGEIRLDRYGDAERPMYMIDDIAGEF